MELGDLYPAILTILLVGIILGLGVFILAEMQDKFDTAATGTDTLVSVNGTLGNNTFTLSDASKSGYELSAVTIINGTTANSVATSGHYNFSSAGVITWEGALVGPTGGTGADFANISSSYSWDATEAPRAVTLVETGMGDFADWIPIIILVIAAGLVIGIVIRSFSREPGV